MAFMDYVEDFVLFKRVLEPTESVGYFAKWVKSGNFLGAISVKNVNQVAMYGGSSDGYGNRQHIDVRETYELYIPKDTNTNKPEYDDFIQRLRDGYFYRIITNPNSMGTPDVSKMRLSVCLLEKTEKPWEGNLYE